MLSGRANHLAETAGDYLSFIATLGALFVAAGGVYATADLEATPSTNVGFVLAGSLLASFVGRALAALSRGLSAGQADLVAGITPLKLAISTGSVVMGAMTYIGNGPNLMVKTIAEKAGYTLPGFVRFAPFAFAAMLPAHLVMTAVFAIVER